MDLCLVFPNFLTVQRLLCYNASAILENVLSGGVNLGGRYPLRLNVGFMLHESVGFSRNFDYNEPLIEIDDDLRASELRGSIRLTRTNQGIYLQGRLDARVPQTCVRCLAEFNQRLSIELADLFVYPPGKATDPILALPDTGILDLAPLVRECLLLEVPLQPTCRPDCQGLCPICGNNRNQTECQHKHSEIDSRFKALESLIGKP